MSQETVRLARHVMEALGRRDLSTLVDSADPEVEWHSFFAQLGEGGYRGYDGTREYMKHGGEGLK
jgi:hypothetical protein